jgi:hypothetical protein
MLGLGLGLYYMLGLGLGLYYMLGLGLFSHSVHCNTYIVLHRPAQNEKKRKRF